MLPVHQCDIDAMHAGWLQSVRAPFGGIMHDAFVMHLMLYGSL